MNTIFVINGKEYNSNQHSLIGYTIVKIEDYGMMCSKIYLEWKEQEQRKWDEDCYGCIWYKKECCNVKKDSSTCNLNRKINEMVNAEEQRLDDSNDE